MPPWIVMCPMNNTSFRIPLVFAIKRNGIPFAEVGEPRGEIYVVGNEKSLTGTELQIKR